MADEIVSADLAVLRQAGGMDRRRILLLRGVNVGGVKLPMAEFRAMLKGLGLADVATFIQSGNAVFTTDGDPLPAIAEGLKARFGIGSALFLYDLATYRGILDANLYAPAGRADGARVHIFFLDRPAPEMDLAGALALAVDGEALTLTDRALYFSAPNGMGRSEMAGRLPKFLKAAHTARNQRSAEAILALAESLPCGS